MSAEEINDVIEDVIDVPDITPTLDADGTDTTDYKALAEERQQLALKNQGIAKRNKTRAERQKNIAAGLNPDGTSKTVVEKKEPVSKPGEMDYGQKAFLISNGIKDADEIALVKEIMESTGKSLDDVIGNKHFQAELEEIREKKATEKATPPGSKRTNQSAADSVDYWLNKKDADGNLVLPTDRKLRQDVVNARISAEKKASQFYNG